LFGFGFGFDEIWIISFGYSFVAFRASQFQL